MDGGALAAISLAANILQFIDWVSHVCKVGSQIRRNGISDFNLDLEATVAGLEHHLQRIRPSPKDVTCTSRADQSLRKVADQCSTIARDLLKTISDIETSVQPTKNNQDSKRGRMSLHIKTLRQAIKQQWKKEDIEELSNKLDQYRRLLDSEILLSVREMVILSSDNLEKLSVNHLMSHNEILSAFEGGRFETDNLIKTGTSLLAEAGRQGKEDVIEAINSFVAQLQRGQIFPVLPQMLYDVDPSLKSPALESQTKIENAVLEALTFRTMFIREAEIGPRHSQTFDWIFEDPKVHDNPWSNFRDWLETGKGCFWIEGKAGSGKSTLMKYISTHPKTMNALTKWAGSYSLVTGSYFFWLAGSTLQKNQEGLLRSLLHTILSKRRDLISRIFPKLYDLLMTREFTHNTSSQFFFSCDQRGCSEAFRQPEQLSEHQLKHFPQNNVASQNHSTMHHTKAKHDEDYCGALRLAELKDAFLAVSRQDLRGVKICLFIDGLDEFVGLPQDILNLFSASTGSTGDLKMLLSSRPEPEFVEAFQHTPSLRLENLTSKDITAYVTESLETHSRMKLLQERNKDTASNLVATVVTRASGVFLWVVLVVRSLKVGLSEGSYLEELEKIVEACPKELRELYQHMFGRMKPAHRVQAAKLFQSISCCLEYEGRLPTALRLSFIDRGDVFSSTEAPIQKLDFYEYQEKISNISDRLRSRCCGLIEVHGDNSEPETPNAIFKRSTRHGEGRLAFLHRSVSEFLKEPGIRLQIEAETRDTTFSVFESNLASLLSCFKSSQFFRIKDYAGWKSYVKNLAFFWDYCRMSGETIGSECQIAYINAMDDALVALWDDSENLHGTSENLRETFFQEDFDNNSNNNYNILCWGRSVLDILKLTLINLKSEYKRSKKSDYKSPLKSYQDQYPMLVIASRFGLSAYVDHQLSSLQCPKTKNCHPVSQSLMVRLICWVMSSECLDLRKEQMATMKCILEHESKLHAAQSSNNCLLEQTAGFVQDSNFKPSQHWAQAPWQILLYLRPLNVPRASFPTLGMAPRQGIFKNRTEVEILDDWATLIMLFINHGVKLDQLSGIQTARDRIRDQMKFLSRPDKYYSAEDREKIDNIQEGLTKIVGSSSPMKDFPVEGQQQQLETTSQCDKVSAAVEIKTSTTHKLNKTSATIIKGHPNLPCTRCKAIKTVTDIGYSADNVIRALDSAGVGSDTQGLVSWLMDHEFDNEASQKNTCTGASASILITESHELMGSNNRNNAALTTHVRTMTTTSVHRQWNIIAAKPKASPKQIVGAQWVTPPLSNSKQKAKRRSKGAVEGKGLVKTQVDSESSSSGCIEINSGNFTWIMDPKDGVGKTPTLSSAQVDALKNFLDTLVSDR